MRGAKPLLPLYSFTEWAATTGHDCFGTVSFNLKCAWANLRLWNEYPSHEVAAGFRRRCLAIAPVRGCLLLNCVIRVIRCRREAKRSACWYVKLLTLVSCSFGMSKWRAQNGCLNCVINWITTKWLLLLCHQLNNETHLQWSQRSRMFESKRQ